MATNNSKWKDFLYLFMLYFRRGRAISVFYTLMLMLALSFSGILIESSAKVKALISKVQKEFLPPNRVQVLIDPNVRNSESAFLGLLGKSQNSSKGKYRDFITQENINILSKEKGVSKIVPLYSIDFPMGIVFAIPGTKTPIQMQMIGSGISEKDALPFIDKDSRIKEFKKTSEGVVPIMLSSFVIPILNTMAKNNGVDFTITAKDLVGYRIRIFVGKSLLSEELKNSSNLDQQDKAEIDNATFSENITCEIVGFVDSDYTLGIAFPQEFLQKYKARLWDNFQADSFDSLLVEVPTTQESSVRLMATKLGLKVNEDTSLFKKVLEFIQKQEEFLQIFLSIISAIIVVFGTMVLVYTLLWILRGKRLEFEVYQFFGASQLKVALLYSSYVTSMNILGFCLSLAFLKGIFSLLYFSLSSLKNKLSSDIAGILDPTILDELIAVPQIFGIGFVVFEIFTFIFVLFYLKQFNRKM